MLRPISTTELVVAVGSFALMTNLPTREGLFGEGAEPGVAGFWGVAGSGVTGATGVPLTAGRARSVSSGLEGPPKPGGVLGHAGRIQGLEAMPQDDAILSYALVCHLPICCLCKPVVLDDGHILFVGCYFGVLFLLFLYAEISTVRPSVDDRIIHVST